MKIGIIGAGLFGCASAIKIKEKFKKSNITIYEEKNDILLGASGKNQFRCHLGYHYPRSTKTIQECLNSYENFKKYYGDCFIKSKNYYGISKENSMTSFDKYISILDRNNLPYKIKKNDLFRYENLTNTILVNEKIINISDVRKKTKNIINKLKINLKCKRKIELNKKFLDDHDIVILATYDKNNHNLRNLNFKKNKYYFQLVEKIVVKVPRHYQNFSAVIIDGPFMCIDPYIHKGFSILGNVRKSVRANSTSERYKFSNQYNNLINGYLIKDKKNSYFNNIKDHMNLYFKNLNDIEYFGSFYVIRCTKKNKRDDRITKVENSKNLFKIFSGKWVNCFETAEEISKII